MSQNPFEALFGNAANLTGAPGAGPAATPRKKADYWLNVGYEVGERGTESYRFVSLPAGIPLDTTDKIEVRSAGEFGVFQTRRNDLLDIVIAKCATLQPGEDIVIGERGQLQMQLRRVSVNEAPVLTADAAFAPPAALLA